MMERVILTMSCMHSED
jgi:hypothetical protein